MITRCFNPVCGTELVYLRQGSLYAWEDGTAPNPRLEFFWLCPSCSRSFDILPGKDGGASLCRKSANSPHPVISPTTRMRKVFSGLLKQAG